MSTGLTLTPPNITDFRRKTDFIKTLVNVLIENEELIYLLYNHPNKANTFNSPIIKLLEEAESKLLQVYDLTNKAGYHLYTKDSERDIRMARFRESVQYYLSINNRRRYFQNKLRNIVSQTDQLIYSVYDYDSKFKGQINRNSPILTLLEGAKSKLCQVHSKSY
jgi:hypothetical protein